MKYKALTFGLPASLCRKLKLELNIGEEGITFASDLWDLTRLCSEELFHIIVFRCQSLNICDDIVAALRRRSFAPVAALADRFDSDMACFVLQAGADLCLPADWSVDLLVTYIAAVFRRYTSYDKCIEAQDLDNTPFTRGDIYIDPGRRIVMVKDREVDLRPREFSLLLYFMRNPGIVLTPERICERAWGMEGSYANGISGPISILRKAIEPDPAHPVYIKTKKAVGYYFAAQKRETCDICSDSVGVL